MPTWNIEEAFNKFQNGTTLRQLGEYYGISYERVRQKLEPVRSSITSKKVKCKRCKKDMTIPVKSSRKYCPACIDINKKNYPTKDLCECGQVKYKTSKKCMKCKAKYSHELAKSLIARNYSVESIAQVFDVTPVTIYRLKKEMYDHP